MSKKQDEIDAAIAYLRSQGLGDIAYTGDSVEQPGTTPVVNPVGEAPNTVNEGASVEQPATPKPEPTAYETEMDNLSKDYTNAVNDGQKSFEDYVLGIAERNRQAEAEMLRQEKVDRMASTATGLTELAANVANLLSVGQLHATPQQYHSYSQDWMKKADMDARERRRRRDNMQAQMDRLNYQIEQVKTANRLGDIKLKMDLAQQKEAARVAAEKEEYNRGIEDRKLGQQDRKLDQEDTALGIREKQADASIEAQKAATAQGWARLAETKRQFNAELAAKGLNPQGEPDEALMKKITETRAKFSTGGKDGEDRVFVDKNGDVHTARMTEKEQEDLFKLAKESIVSDLGEQGASDFQKEYRAAMDQFSKDAVLKKWMAQSPTCGAAIRLLDPTYGGVHGPVENKPAENTAGYAKGDEQKGLKRYK